MTEPTEPTAVRLARGVVAALLRAGIGEVVLAPGSRNAPLAFAVWDAARAGRLRLHTRVDERTAGFLALGLTRVGARAAVICTSGTAVANLHPAVLEASHSAVPLVVVSADRPASLRGTGASQTTDQVRMFGDAAAFVDLAEEAELAALDALLAPGAGSPGPLQLNVQLSGTLVPVEPWPAADIPVATVPDGPRIAGSRAADVYRARLAEGSAHALPAGPRTVVVAGDDAGPPARILAEAAGWPLLAEPSSGARTGPNALRCYRLLLDTDLGAQVERVVVVGHPTLSRPITRLVERPDVEVVSVRHAGRWARRPFPVAAEHDAVAAPDASSFADAAWLAAWQEADRAAARRVDALVAAEGEPTPYEVAGAVARALPAGGLLVVGASSPIRDLDLMGAVPPAGQRRLVLANRGLAGIDGTVSTAIGAALGRPHSTRAIALVGDVTFLHDHGGLVLGPREEQPDLTIVVVNDDGGSIFAMLEQGDPTYADAFDTLFGTPHGVDLASLCAATRTPHWRVESVAELEHALASPAGGLEVVEVRVRRDNRRALDTALRGLGA